MSLVAVWVAPSLWPLWIIKNQMAKKLTSVVNCTKRHRQHNQPTQTKYENQKPNETSFNLTAGGRTLFVAGCAEMGWKYNILVSAAGFRVRTPQTPKQQQTLRRFATLQGGACHRYKDTFFMCIRTRRQAFAYVGREQEYQNYQQLAIQQQIAQNYLYSSGNGPCSRIWLVRSVGSARFLVVKGNAPMLAHSRSELRRMKDSSLKRMIRSATCFSKMATMISGRQPVATWSLRKTVIAGIGKSAASGTKPPGSTDEWASV
jgi:hypothetical protein